LHPPLNEALQQTSARRAWGIAPAVTATEQRVARPSELAAELWRYAVNDEHFEWFSAMASVVAVVRFSAWHAGIRPAPVVAPLNHRRCDRHARQAS